MQRRVCAATRVRFVEIRRTAFAHIRHPQSNNHGPPQPASLATGNPRSVQSRSIKRFPTLSQVEPGPWAQCAHRREPDTLPPFRSLAAETGDSPRKDGHEKGRFRRAAEPARRRHAARSRRYRRPRAGLLGQRHQPRALPAEPQLPLAGGCRRADADDAVRLRADRSPDDSHRRPCRRRTAADGTRTRSCPGTPRPPDLQPAAGQGDRGPMGERGHLQAAARAPEPRWRGRRTPADRRIAPIELWRGEATIQPSAASVSEIAGQFKQYRTSVLGVGSDLRFEWTAADNKLPNLSFQLPAAALFAGAFNQARWDRAFSTMALATPDGRIVFAVGRTGRRIEGERRRGSVARRFGEGWPEPDAVRERHRRRTGAHRGHRLPDVHAAVLPRRQSDAAGEFQHAGAGGDRTVGRGRAAFALACHLPGAGPCGRRVRHGVPGGVGVPEVLADGRAAAARASRCDQPARVRAVRRGARHHPAAHDRRLFTAQRRRGRAPAAPRARGEREVHRRDRRRGRAAADDGRQRRERQVFPDERLAAGLRPISRTTPAKSSPSRGRTRKSGSISATRISSPSRWWTSRGCRR